MTHLFYVDDHEFHVAEYQRVTQGTLGPISAHIRTVRQREVTFVCAICGVTTTQERYPGPLPRYCGTMCRQVGGRQAAAERMRRMRRRQHQASVTLLSEEHPDCT